MTPFREEVELGVENGPIRKFNIGFLLAPHNDRSAISDLSAELSNVTDRRTDGRTDGIGIAIVDLMLRATRWHRSQKLTFITWATRILRVTSYVWNPISVGNFKAWSATNEPLFIQHTS